MLDGEGRGNVAINGTSSQTFEICNHFVMVKKMTSAKDSKIEELSMTDAEHIAGGLPKPSIPPQRYELRWQLAGGSISLEEAEARGYIPGADPT